MPDDDITWHDLVRGEVTFAAKDVPDFVVRARQRRPAVHARQPGRRRPDADHARAARRGPAVLDAAPDRAVPRADRHRCHRPGAAVRPPALRHGRGQQEAVQARSAVVAERLPRGRLPARGAAELPRAARLVHRPGPRRVLAGRDGRRVRRRRRQRQSCSIRPEEARRDQRHAHPRCSSRPTSPAGCRSRRTRRASPTRTAWWRRLHRWCRSGCTPSARASTSSASCSSATRSSGSTRPRRPSSSATPGARSCARRCPRSQRSTDWTAAQLEAALKATLVDGLGLKPRNAFGPLRVAVTGRAVSPPLFESMELLGRERSIRRLEAGLVAG